MPTPWRSCANSRSRASRKKRRPLAEPVRQALPEEPAVPVVQVTPARPVEQELPVEPEVRATQVQPEEQVAPVRQQAIRMRVLP